MTFYIIIAVAIIFVFIIVTSIRRSSRKYKIALNCLMAKAAFEQANEDLQITAVVRSCQVLKNMGYKEPKESFEKMSEVEKCAVFAVAFAELGTPPPFKNEVWRLVSKPFTGIKNVDAAFAAARRHLKKMHGVDL